MINLIHSIGVLLTFGGFTCFVMGLISVIIPAFANIIPDEFKKVFTMQTGALIFLVGLVLLYVV